VIGRVAVFVTNNCDVHPVVGLDTWVPIAAARVADVGCDRAVRSRIVRVGRLPDLPTYVVFVANRPLRIAAAEFRRTLGRERTLNEDGLATARLRTRHASSPRSVRPRSLRSMRAMLTGSLGWYVRLAGR
jgi:hypothetical protein